MSKYNKNKEKYIKELLKVPGLTINHIKKEMEKLRKKFKQPVSEEALLYVIMEDLKKKGHI